MINIDFSQFSILMVDDIPKNLQLLGNTLKKENYRIEFATNAKQAMEWLKLKEFDLLLLDIMMPGMDGFELCKEIRQLPNYEDVPIIFITARTDMDSVLRGFELGGQDFITKPFDSRELIARIRTQLEIRFHRKNLLGINKILEEKVLERTQELEKVNTELEKMNLFKNSFLELIAREIDSPLNEIISTTEFLKSYTTDSSVSNLLEILDLSTGRLNSFSNTALLLARIGSPESIKNRQNLMFKESLNRALKKYKDQIEASNLRFRVEENEVNINLFGDPQLIDSAVEIIVDQSIRYSNPHSEISIRFTRSEDHIYFELIDGGVGFSPTELNASLDLMNLDPESADTRAGIHLTLVNHIFKVHGGSLIIENTDNGRGRIRLQFPD